MSMERLPEEILLMIFAYIVDFRMMIKLERVCRRWHKIMRNHGWKHVRQVAYCPCILQESLKHRIVEPYKWIAPVGKRCGDRLVECNLYSVTIDSKLVRRIAKYFPAIRHLKLYSCRFEFQPDNKVLDPLLIYGTRLRSLTLYKTEYHPQLGHNLLRHFPHLRHLGLYFPFHHNYDVNDICGQFSVHLRSLYITHNNSFSPDLEQMLVRVQTDIPGLMALYLDTSFITESVLLRIAELKNLRFLCMSCADDPYKAPNANPNLLFSCLANLPHLRALQIFVWTQKFLDLFRSLPLHGLIHLNLDILVHQADIVNFEPIGLLSTVAPKLRSLNMKIFVPSKDVTQEIGNKVLKIAQSGILEHLNVPCALFTIAQMDQLVRLSPNLHSIYTCISSPVTGELPSESEFAELRRVVADQWRAGTRKHVPLRIWIRGISAGHTMSGALYQDPFLTIHHVNSSFVPHNPVLTELFREEIFNDNDDGRTPSFVTGYYDGLQSEAPVPMNDLVIS